MEKDVFAVVILILITIIMFIMFCVIKDDVPHYSKEVYFYEGTDKSVAPILGATVASDSQTVAYLQLGGAKYDGGMYLYGPKPRIGTFHVKPFNSSQWFFKSGNI